MSANQVVYELSLRDLLTPKLQEAERQAQRFEGTLGSIGEAAQRVGGLVAGAFTVHKVFEFGRSIVDVGAHLQNTETGLTTLLKSGAEAKQVIANTMQDAMTTPFEFDSLLQANKALISANETAEGARDVVLDLANAIAATGGSNAELTRMVVNLQQIKNTGEATALDIKQFAYAGINIYKVLEEAGIKVKEGNEDVKITYEQLAHALDKAHAAGGLYANGLENMSNNVSVRISNIGDTLFKLKAQMFQDLQPAIESGLQTTARLVDGLADLWEWAKRNSDAFEAVGSAVLVAGGAFVVWRGYLLGAAAAARIVTVYNGIMTLGYVAYSGASATASGATIFFTGAVNGLNAAFRANPVGFVIAGLAAITAAVVYAWKNFGEFRGVVMGVWATIREFVGIAGASLKGLGMVLHGILTVDPDMVERGLATGVNAIANAGSRLAGSFRKGCAEGMADFAKDQAQGNPVERKGLDATKKVQKSVAQTGSVTPVRPTAGSGSKAVTINIRIGSLVEKFSINTTNLHESTSKIREHVAQALLSAVNDAQVVAGG